MRWTKQKVKADIHVPAGTEQLCFPGSYPAWFLGVRDPGCLGHVPGCSSGWHLWADRCGLGAGRPLSRPGRGSGCCGSWPSTGRTLQVWNWAGACSGRGGWALWGQDSGAVRKSQWKRVPVLPVQRASKLTDVCGFSFSQSGFSVIKLTHIRLFLYHSVIIIIVWLSLQKSHMAFFAKNIWFWPVKKFQA